MEAAPPKYLYGIIGWPLGHTASPALHTWLFKQQAVPAAYYSWPVKEGHLPEFIKSMRLLPIHGLSVTIPHKQTVMEYLDEVDSLVQKVGAVNTLYWRGDKLCGSNTDVEGFLAPLIEKGNLPRRALVLGAGGSARAVLAALSGLPARVDIFIASRTLARAEALALEFGAQALAWEARCREKVDLVVNTTPLGMQGVSPEGTPLTASDFTKLAQGENERPLLAYDLIYRPLHTNFLKNAKAAGWQTQDGLDMLIAQGLRQFEIWTGITDLPLPWQIRKTSIFAGFS